MAGTFHTKTRVITILALLCFLCSHRIKSPNITIYTIPAPHEMRWESPGKLVFRLSPEFSDPVFLWKIPASDRSYDRWN